MENPYGKREINGYGIKTTRWSVTSIGAEGEGRTAASDAILEKAAARVEHQLKGVHLPAKGNLHLQVHYPRTAGLLQTAVPGRHSNTRRETPRELKTFDRVAGRWVVPANVGVDTDGVGRPANFASKAKEIKGEFEWNHARRFANVETGRQSVVKDIIERKPAPAGGKEYLFPTGASHMQLLALTNNLGAPDAGIRAPPPVRHKQWLGSAVGWEGAP